MPRWRLTQKHYLKVPGTEYEYREQVNGSSRAIKRVFPVPLYLDPEDPADCNYPGEIIVAQGKDAQPKDIIFEGAPTPDMAPLDPEAQAITDEYMSRWGKSAENMGDEGYTGGLLAQLTETLQAFNASSKPSSAVDDDRFNRLMEMNMALIAKLDTQPTRRA
jgi:hypothetical protein